MGQGGEQRLGLQEAAALRRPWPGAQEALQVPQLPLLWSLQARDPHCSGSPSGDQRTLGPHSPESTMCCGSVLLGVAPGPTSSFHGGSSGPFWFGVSSRSCGSCSRLQRVPSVLAGFRLVLVGPCGSVLPWDHTSRGGHMEGSWLQASGAWSVCSLAAGDAGRHAR